MLLKLLKHDVRSSLKYLMPFIAALIVLIILGTYGGKICADNTALDQEYNSILYSPAATYDKNDAVVYDEFGNIVYAESEPEQLENASEYLDNDADDSIWYSQLKHYVVYPNAKCYDPAFNEENNEVQYDMFNSGAQYVYESDGEYFQKCELYFKEVQQKKDIDNTPLNTFFNISGTFALVIATIAFAVAPAIMLVFMLIMYYKKLWTDEGYLTFTLPVSGTQIYLSKLIVIAVFEILTIILALVGLWISYVPMLNVFDLSLREIIQMIAKLFVEIEYADKIFGTLAIMVASIVVAGINSLIMFTTVINATCSIAKKNKVLLSFIMILVVSTVEKFIADIFTTIMMVSSDMFNIESGIQVLGIINNSMYVTIGINIIFAAVSFFISKIVLTKKLNVE